MEDSLVDPHLPVVVGVGSVSAGGLSGAELESLGGHSHWASDLDLLDSVGVGLLDSGLLDQVGAEGLEWLDLGEGHGHGVLLQGRLLGDFDVFLLVLGFVLTHLYKVYNFKKIKITYEKFGAPWWPLRLRGNGPLQR